MRVVLWMLGLYPPAWRERYEAEMVALLEQHQITLWTVLDLLVGALDARLDPHYRMARQLLPLRRFQTSWKLVVVGLVAFWITLLPWLWMSVLGLGSDTQCGQWQNNYALCMLRVMVGMHTASLAQTLLGTLPLLFMAGLSILVMTRGRQARTHLLLVLPVTIGMQPDVSGLLLWLITWVPAGIVGFITARLVKSPDKKQTERASQKPRRATSPLVWAALLPLSFFLVTFWSNIPSDISLPVPLWVKLLVYFFFAAFVSGMTALVVTIRRNLPRFERPLRYVGIGAASVLFILGVLRTGILLPWAGPGGWLVVSCLCIIPALFVRMPGGHPQAERTTKPPPVDAAPKEWARFLLILLLIFTLQRLGPTIFGNVVPMLIANLFILIAICLLPALMVKIRNSNQQAEGVTKPLHNSLSPRVWIIVSPVLFLVICMEIEFIFMPDYPDFNEALIVWFLTGLASLIILVSLKLGSRASTALPHHELLQQTYEQG